MTDSWKVICASISNCLINTTITMPANVDWNDVFLEAEKQRITSIVRCGSSYYVPGKFKDKWKITYYNDLGYASYVIEVMKKLVDLMNIYKIPFCILKGTSVAVYYPEPLLRSMGDIDFIVQKEYIEKTKEILIQEGFIPDLGEEKDPRHQSFSYKEEICCELHQRFSFDEMDIDIDTIIENSYEKLETGKIRGVSFPMLPPLENGLVILDHLRHHLYSGLGMRQVLDWMMYVNNILDDKYWEETFSPVARSLGFEKLACVTTRLCQIYFGLSSDLHWCRNIDDNVCEEFMNCIIESGNFGKANGLGANIEHTIINFRNRGFFSYLQTAGEYNWEAYHKHPWLKPVAWIYQVFRYIKQGLQVKKIKGSLKNDFIRSEKRYQLLKDLDLLNNKSR